MATMMVFQRVKSSGKCPPSLISQSRMFEDDGFDATLNPLFEDQSGLALGSASSVTSGFSSAVQLAASFDKFPSKMDPQKKAAVLEFRRCLLLAIVGATPSENQALQQIVNGGFLGIVKKWLDDILAGNVGGTDLLLHMLSNVSELPVSKSAVMSSGLGKVIGAIGKHKICVGTANEQTIKSTIVQVKQNWSASVKQKRREDTASIINKTKKVPSSNNEIGGGNPKSAPTDDKKDPLSSKFTSLVTKVSGPSAENKVQWADHSGGDLEEAQTQGGGKRDRVQDAADFLAHAKRSKIDRDVSDPRNGMRPTSFWHSPMLLRVTSNIAVESGELEEQKRRVNTVTPPVYVSDRDVPRNPNAQTEGEQARDLATSSFSSSSIPFFTPKHIAMSESLNFQKATSEQQMHSPKGSSLRGNISDSKSGYDEGRSFLVQQIMDHGQSQFGQQQQQSSQMSIYQQAQGSGSSHLQQISSQQQQHGVGNHSGSSNGSRQDKGSNSGNSDKNLHVSGYGPNTTLADIVNLFAPHVQVTEVVMKRGFAFVNTNDASRARRAKEVLNGALLNGSPIRINFAQRSSRDGGFSNTSTNTSSSSNTHGGGGGHNRSSSYGRGDGGLQLPQNQYGQIDYDAVRDDRGNPATKNLFVAGYGAGTTEHQLGDIFGQHAVITGCVMKGTFSFVNTSDKVSAVHARNALAGSVLNGGVMRINFAKESGRLGTNF